MVRKIKFRGFDALNKKLIYGDLVHDRGNVYIRNSDGFVAVFEVQQYTGLKDKNGKEIYEGDIVRRYEAVKDWMSKEPSSRLFQVRWSSEGAWFELDHAAPWADGTNWSPMNMRETAQYVEVIGNIWENPELLR